MAGIIDLAIAHHREGRLAEALEIYELILSTDPTPNPDILHLAGMAYFATSHFDKAEKHLGLAAAAAPMRADFQFGHGNVLSAMGRNAEALQAFRLAAGLAPDTAAIWFNLGNAARACSQFDLAREASAKALALDPAMNPALNNLASMLLEENRFAEFGALLEQLHESPRFVELARLGILKAAAAHAVNGLRPALQALSEKYPGNPRPPWMLGYDAFLHRRFDCAEAFYRRAVDLAPDALEPRAMLGCLLASRGERAEALLLLASAHADRDGETLLALVVGFESVAASETRRVALLEAVREAAPNAAKILHFYLFHMMGMDRREQIVDTLRTVMPKASQDEEYEDLAISYLTQAVHDHPGEYLPHLMLSMLHAERQNVEQALALGQRAVELNPADVGASIHRARLAMSLDMTESIRILEAVLVHQPDSPELLDFMGALQMRVGNMQAAIVYLDRARALITPEMGEKFQTQLLPSNYRGDLAPETVAHMHLTWGAAVEAKLSSERQSHNAAGPKTMLRVGYVSGDYKDTSPSYFMLPLMRHHNPARIEIFCYASQEKDDEITPVFKALATKWRDVHAMTDSDLATLIRDDAIDILVDLSAHTMGGRLPVFARKPAPVQVTWLGYPNTTGLKAIDYRFTDALADPPRITDAWHSEALYRLPHFLCYQPPAETPEVAGPPAAENGYVTFGCFNNSNKITDEVVSAWVQILRGVPSAKLILKTAELADRKTADAFKAKFHDRGIASGRVECYPSVPGKFDHLGIYSLVDLSLDPFPYNGTTTTFESLWMGVPALTLAGKTHAARVGVSILNAAGLPELVADTVVSYIAAAIDLANHPARLAEYRRTMRTRLLASPLMDAGAFARSVEAAYFEMYDIFAGQNA